MEDFPSAARETLIPVAGQVHQVRESAELGGLRMDKTEAQVLLASLAKIRSRADELVTGCGPLDRPLRFGDNWVGAIVSERLQAVAATENQSMTSVMTQFRQVIDDLEATVRAAAHLYVTTDEQGAVDLRKAAQRLGLTDVTAQGDE